MRATPLACHAVPGRATSFGERLRVTSIRFDRGWSDWTGSWRNKRITPGTVKCTVQVLPKNRRFGRTPVRRGNHTLASAGVSGRQPEWTTRGWCCRKGIKEAAPFRGPERATPHAERLALPWIGATTGKSIGRVYRQTMGSRCLFPLPHWLLTRCCLPPKLGGGHVVLKGRPLCCSNPTNTSWGDGGVFSERPRTFRGENRLDAHTPNPPAQPPPTPNHQKPPSPPRPQPKPHQQKNTNPKTKKKKQTTKNKKKTENTPQQQHTKHTTKKQTTENQTEEQPPTGTRENAQHPRQKPKNHSKKNTNPKRKKKKNPQKKKRKRTKQKKEPTNKKKTKIKTRRNKKNKHPHSKHKNKTQNKQKTENKKKHKPKNYKTTTNTTTQNNKKNKKKKKNKQKQKKS